MVSRGSRCGGCLCRGASCSAHAGGIAGPAERDVMALLYCNLHILTIYLSYTAYIHVYVPPVLTQRVFVPNARIHREVSFAAGTAALLPLLEPPRGNPRENALRALPSRLVRRFSRKPPDDQNPSQAPTHLLLFSRPFAIISPCDVTPADEFSLLVNVICSVLDGWIKQGAATSVLSDQVESNTN